MPMHVEIDHSHKFVRIVAEGHLTLKDFEGHFDEIFVAGAMGYAKLLDITAARPTYDDDDVMMVAARVSAYTAELPSGPLAVIGKPNLRGSFRRFVNVSPSDRPAKYFASEEKARAWLATLAAGQGKDSAR